MDNAEHVLMMIQHLPCPAVRSQRSPVAERGESCREIRRRIDRLETDRELQPDIAEAVPADQSRSVDGSSLARGACPGRQ